MRLIDEKYKKNKRKYILQCLIASMIVLVIAVLLDVFLQTAIVASVGATVFIVYTMPHTKRSRIRYIIGGYTVGIIVGALMYYASSMSATPIRSLYAALAVGLCIFLMVITNTEHPPAAAVAMGIVIEGVDVYTVFIIYLSICIVLIGKELLKKWLIDLL